MQTQWPLTIPKVFRKVASFDYKLPQIHTMADVHAMEHARKLADKENRLRCAQSFRQLLYNRSSDFTAKASFTSEATILGTGVSQPVIWHPMMDFTQVNRQFSLFGKGVLSTTGTPTYTFAIRMGSLAANSGTSITGAILGTSAAITTGSGVTNVAWAFQLDFIVTTTIGIGSGNTTVSAAGFVKSPGGFAAPYEYALEPTTPDTATWTQTCDCSIDNFIQVTAACSASSASNTLTLKQLTLEALN